MGILPWGKRKRNDEVSPDRYNFDNPYNRAEAEMHRTSGYAGYIQDLSIPVGGSIPGTSSVGRLADSISGPYHVLECGSSSVAFTQKSPTDGERYKCPCCGHTHTIRASGDTFIFT